MRVPHLSRDAMVTLQLIRRVNKEFANPSSLQVAPQLDCNLFRLK